MSRILNFWGDYRIKQLQVLYQSAFAVIVPSICYEVFGMIIIESFAQRTPVVVNNLGALPGIVQQSGGGCVYRTEDELIHHMEKFRHNPQLRNGLGNRGYQAYRKYWTEEYHIQCYYQLMKEVAERKKIHNPAIDAL